MVIVVVGEKKMRDLRRRNAKFEQPLVGSKAMIEHLKSLTPENRPDLAAAFAAAGDTDVQIVVVPSKDHRRVIEELMPALSTLWAAPTTTQEEGPATTSNPA